MKYVTFSSSVSDDMAVELFIVFHDHLVHAEMFEAVQKSIQDNSKQCVVALGAGYVDYKNDVPVCWGYSDSMNLKNRGVLDDEILKRTSTQFVYTNLDPLENVAATFNSVIPVVRSHVNKLRNYPIYVSFGEKDHPVVLQSETIGDVETRFIAFGDFLSYVGPTIDDMGNYAHMVRFDETELAYVDPTFFSRFVFPYSDVDSILEMAENAWVVLPPEDSVDFYNITSQVYLDKLGRHPDYPWEENPYVRAIFLDHSKQSYIVEDRLNSLLSNVHKYLMTDF